MAESCDCESPASGSLETVDIERSFPKKCRLERGTNVGSLFLQGIADSGTLIAKRNKQ